MGDSKTQLMCHPRSPVLKPALPEQQHKCPICVCLPVETDSLEPINCAIFFYKPWQLTGSWERELCDTATQQISTSSASCGFEQIRSLPPSRHNRAATSKQPPQPQNFLVWSFCGTQLHQGGLLWAHPYPIWQYVCVSGEQILPLAWEFNDHPFSERRGGGDGGGCVLCLLCNRGAGMWPHTPAGPQDGSTGFSRHSWSQQIKHTCVAHLHFPRKGDHL